MSKKLDIIGNYYCYRVDLVGHHAQVRRCLLGWLALNRFQQYRNAPLQDDWEAKTALDGITDYEARHARANREPVYVPVPGGFGNDVVWGRWHSCNR